MDYSEQTDLTTHTYEDTFPSDKSLWRVGSAIAERFRNRKLLGALYKDERLADMMFRYFSGETLEQIGEAYGLTRERVRQLCKKGVNRLMAMLSYFTKDVVEMKVDKEAVVETKSDVVESESVSRKVGLEGINGMRFSKRARTVFRRHGISSVEQLQRFSKSDLMKLPGLGRKTLVEIIRVLEYANTPESSQKSYRLRPWTEGDIEQVIELKRSGKSFQEIAAQVDRFTVDVQDQYYIRMRVLRDKEALSDLSSRDSADANDPESRRHPLLWSEEESTQLVTMRSQGMPVRDIAEQLQRNQREVNSKLEELGLKVRYRNIADFTDEEKDELANRFHQGETLAGLALDQHLKQVDLAQLLAEKGELPERYSRVGQPWDLQETDTVRGYIERGYSISEIGYRLGRDHREVTSKIYELIKSK